MERHPCTTDKSGFNYMANTGQEEKDRDYIGIIIALAIIAFITACQYNGML